VASLKRPEAVLIQLNFEIRWNAIFHDVHERANSESNS
jgi:hypothetical protein